MNEEKIFIYQNYGKGRIMHKYANKSIDELLDIILDLERENRFLKDFIKGTSEFKQIEKLANTPNEE